MKDIIPLVRDRSKSLGIKWNDNCENAVLRIINNEKARDYIKQRAELLKRMFKECKHIMEVVNIETIATKAFAEVFTPKKLVDDMLNTFPREVWSDDTIKWCDPSIGTAIFFWHGVIPRLMDGLAEKYPNEKDRKSQIAKMLYGVDIQKLNVGIARAYIIHMLGEDNAQTIKERIICADSLAYHFWNDTKFTFVGNPPYNAFTECGGATGNTIYQAFMKNCIERTADGGYLCFVNPPSWRKPLDQSETWKHVAKYQFETLHIHDNKDGMKMFGKGTRYDYYLIHKVPVHKETVVIGEDGVECKVDFRKWEWLPNKNFDLIQKILGGGCEIICDASTFDPRKKWVSKVPSPNHPYKLVHATNKDGVRWCYSSKNDSKKVKMFGVPKVIFGDGGINGRCVIDINGEYGMTQHAMAIKVSSLQEAENLKKALESKEFESVLDATVWSSYAIDWSMFKFFRKDFWKEFI